MVEMVIFWLCVKTQSFKTAGRLTSLVVCVFSLLQAKSILFGLAFEVLTPCLQLMTSIPQDVRSACCGPTCPPSPS